MQRTFADDLKWAVAVLVGVTIGYLAFGNGDTGLLIGSLIGVTIAIVGLNVARWVARQSGALTSRRSGRPRGRRARA